MGRGVSNIRPVLESVSFWVGREFLLHAPCWNTFGRLAGGESLLHAPCWNLFVGLGVSLLFVPYWNLAVTWVRTLSYTPRVEICLVVRRVGSLSYSLLSGICLVVRWVGSVSYSSRSAIFLSFSLCLSCWPILRMKYYLVYFYAKKTICEDCKSQ